MKLRVVVVMFFVLLFSGCTPDENTAEDMQKWKDACDMVDSCKTWVDSTVELELSESQLLIGMKNELEEFGSDIDTILVTLEAMQEEIDELREELEKLTTDKDKIEYLAKSVLPEHFYVDVESEMGIYRVSVGISLTSDLEIDIENEEAGINQNIDEMNAIYDLLIFEGFEIEFVQNRYYVFEVIEGKRLAYMLEGTVGNGNEPYVFSGREYVMQDIENVVIETEFNNRYDIMLNHLGGQLPGDPDIVININNSGEVYYEGFEQDVALVVERCEAYYLDLGYNLYEVTFYTEVTVGEEVYGFEATKPYGEEIQILFEYAGDEFNQLVIDIYSVFDIEYNPHDGGNIHIEQGEESGLATIDVYVMDVMQSGTVFESEALLEEVKMLIDSYQTEMNVDFEIVSITYQDTMIIGNESFNFDVYYFDDRINNNSNNPFIDFEQENKQFIEQAITNEISRILTEVENIDLSLSYNVESGVSLDVTGDLTIYFANRELAVEFVDIFVTEIVTLYPVTSWNINAVFDAMELNNGNTVHYKLIVYKMLDHHAIEAVDYQ